MVGTRVCEENIENGLQQFVVPPNICILNNNIIPAQIVETTVQGFFIAKHTTKRSDDQKPTSFEKDYIE